MKRKRYKSGNPVLMLVVLITVIAVICVVIVESTGKKEYNTGSSTVSSENVSRITESLNTESIVSNASTESIVSNASTESIVSNASVSSAKSVNITSSKAETKVTLDPDYERLILVNGDNALPKDYNYTGNLITVPQKYLCGWRNQLDKDVWVYAKAMIEAAWKDGVELYILSPYRSYETQETLFSNEVEKWEKKGYKGEDAENKASTVVARPGTSEHHTGLAIDFNSVEHSFENTEIFKWLQKNAADYGFIMRYSEEKQPITGVIYESWHWRFVGIKHAKKIVSKGICLEEYIEGLEN